MTIDEINVFAGSGGQGCTTLALLLAIETGGRFETYQPEVAACILGSPIADLQGDRRVGPWVWDVGTRNEVINGSTVAIIRGPTYPALRALNAAPHRPDRVVLLEEPYMSIRSRDVKDVLEREVFVIGFDPNLARAIDAGLLTSKRPGWVKELATWLGLRVPA